MYSQNDEERVILERLAGRPPGRLLDIGAADGLLFSNSRALIERGWSADLVEPCPVHMAKLLELYGGNDYVTLHNYGVSAEAPHSAPLYWSGEQIASTSRTLLTRYGYQEPVTMIVMLQDILNVLDYRHVFLSLDADGMNFDLLQRLVFGIPNNLQLICIEHEDQQDEMIDLLGEQDFSLIHETGENLLFWRDR